MHIFSEMTWYVSSSTFNIADSLNPNNTSNKPNYSEKQHIPQTTNAASERCSGWIHPASSPVWPSNSRAVLLAAWNNVTNYITETIENICHKIAAQYILVIPLQI